MMQESIVAENIRRIIDKHCYKQSAIAKRAGYTRQQFSSMLNSRKLILADDCIRLRDALDCTYEELFCQPEQ